MIELGHDPKDVKATERLIKKKNDDIAALSKKLKHPPLLHPQTAKVIEKQNKEELMDLVLKLNEQLKETEIELEKPLQSKQGEPTTIPQTVIPIISIAVPSTIATSLAPNIPLATALPVTTIASTSKVAVISTKKIEDLIKSMEEMKIQAIEIKKLKEMVTSLEKNYELS